MGDTQKKLILSNSTGLKMGEKCRKKSKPSAFYDSIIFLIMPRSDRISTRGIVSYTRLLRDIFFEILIKRFFIKKDH
jgi:hypothetical protein